MTDETKKGRPAGEVPIDAADFMGPDVAKVAYDPPLDLGPHGKFASPHGGLVDEGEPNPGSDRA